jgi:hypothetical protein
LICPWTFSAYEKIYKLTNKASFVRLPLLSLDPIPIRGFASGDISNRDQPKNQFKQSLRQVCHPIPWGSLAIQLKAENARFAYIGHCTMPSIKPFFLHLNHSIYTD